MHHVTLIGRPNVGKSTLFNRLIGKRQAIVADEAGTTRDRIEGKVDWEGKSFGLVDMAGLETSLTQDNPLSRATQAQVMTAIREADLLIWVVDSKEELAPNDYRVADLLRKTGKPVIVAVNKCDQPLHDERLAEFAGTGFGEIITLSGLHGRGITDLLDAIVANLPEHAVQSAVDERELRIAILGRPNVGKSTLFNTLVGSERTVVSDVPGTTRDTIDTVVAATDIFGTTFTKWRQVRILDTAGIRRRGRVEQGVEKWSVMRSMQAIEDAEIILLLIDAMEGMVHQDLQVASSAIEAGRPLILVINKWDLVLEMKGAEPGSPEDILAQEHFLIHLRQSAGFLYWAQVLFISAKEHTNVEVVGKLVAGAYQAWSIVPSEEDMADLTEQLQRYPRLRNLKKISFEHSKPPVFHLHVEGASLPHFSTIRAVENAIREYFEIGPAPMKIWSVPTLPKRKKKKSN